MNSIPDRCSNYFNFSQQWVKKIEDCGTVVQILTPASPIIYSLWKRDYSGLASITLALIVNQLCIEIMKRFIPETRPNGHSRSFPSGHTMATAFGAAVFIKRYEISNIPIILVLSSCVIGVGFSRVIARAHWIHDVVAGAIFGSLIACFVRTLARE